MVGARIIQRTCLQFSFLWVVLTSFFFSGHNGNQDNFFIDAGEPRMHSASGFLFSAERLNLAANDSSSFPYLTKFKIRQELRHFSFEYSLPPLPHLGDNMNKSSDSKVGAQDQHFEKTESGSIMYNLKHFSGNDHIISQRQQQRELHHSVIGLSPFVEQMLNDNLLVTYTNDPITVEKWVKKNIEAAHSTSINAMGHKDNQSLDDTTGIQVVGFDVESVPNCSWIQAEAQHDSGPATIQISTLNSALVIQLTHRSLPGLTSLLKPLIQPVLRNPNTMLVGADIDGDIMELHTFAPHIFGEVTSRFDIGGVGASSINNRVGLKTLVEILLCRQFDKRRSISVSDWSRVPLSFDQIWYSARDAWAGCAVATALAMHDPTTFGFESVMHTMCIRKKERPVKQLVHRAKKRRSAKVELKSLNRSHPPGNTYIDIEGGHLYVTNPYWVHERRRRLRQILRDTKPDGLLLFHLQDKDGQKQIGILSDRTILVKEGRRVTATVQESKERFLERARTDSRKSSERNPRTGISRKFREIICKRLFR